MAITSAGSSKGLFAADPAVEEDEVVDDCCCEFEGGAKDSSEVPELEFSYLAKRKIRYENL